MSEFTPPTGINFRSKDSLPLVAACEVLQRIAAFLQTIDPYLTLVRFDDWWQHDGLHFRRGPLDFHKLFLCIATPRNLLESAPRDEAVYVGVAPEDNSWYLRFRAEWDDTGNRLQAHFDVTVPDSLADRFRHEIAHSCAFSVVEQDARQYYDGIRL